MCVCLSHELSINQSVIGSICVEWVPLTWFLWRLTFGWYSVLCFGGAGVGLSNADGNYEIGFPLLETEPISFFLSIIRNHLFKHRFVDCLYFAPEKMPDHLGKHLLTLRQSGVSFQFHCWFDKQNTRSVWSTRTHEEGRLTEWETEEICITNKENPNLNKWIEIARASERARKRKMLFEIELKTFSRSFCVP